MVGVPLGRLVVSLLSLVALALAVAMPVSQVHSQLVFGKLNFELYSRLNGDSDGGYEMAPMIKRGDPAPGRWREAGEDLFQSILSNTGIITCFTDPIYMSGRPGVLGIIKKSEVLNNGKRATMGWFIRAKKGLTGPVSIGEWVTDPLTGVKLFRDSGEVFYPPGPELFVLMSYDFVPDLKRLDDGDPQKSHLCAFEVFIFGPVTRPKADQSFEPWAPLVQGVAVNGDGDILQGVPEALADVRNFLPNFEGPRVIFSFINVPGAGCRVCHEETEQFPQETLPFPWLGAPESEAGE